MNCPLDFTKTLWFFLNGLDTGLFAYLEACQNLQIWVFQGESF